jgi:hypothetical protein
MKRLAIIGLASVLLSGCAAAGLTVAGAGAGVAMGSGVEHTMTGITYKTFSVPVAELRIATVQSLKRMDMKLEADGPTEEGWALQATARDRVVDIELESLTARTTRMRVVANKGQLFFKDASTATEIIMQTAQTLDDQAVARAAKEAAPDKQATTVKGKRT